MARNRVPYRVGQRVFRNTDAYFRAWAGIQDPLTGQTLGLGPGQAIALDLPEDFEDPWLREDSLRNRIKGGESASRPNLAEEE